MSSGSYATRAGFREDGKPGGVPACPGADDEPRGPGLYLAGLCCACGRATSYRDADGHPRHRPASPRRVRVLGDLFHGQVPDGAVYVGRAAPWLPRSPWANPYAGKSLGRAELCRLHREHLAGRPGDAPALRRDLAGRDLACWCPAGEPCHADLLLALANG